MILKTFPIKPGKYLIAAFILGSLSLTSPGKAQQPGTIQSIAGGGAPGDGGTAADARLLAPSRVTTDGAGNIYFFDLSDGLRIRKVDRNGFLTTRAGRGMGADLFTNDPFSDGPLALNFSLNFSPGFRTLGGAVADGKGNLFFTGADSPRNGPTYIYQAGPTGQITRSFLIPQPSDSYVSDLDIDDAGNLYALLIRQDVQSYIYKIAPDGTVTHLAGVDEWSCPTPLPCGEGTDAAGVYLAAGSLAAAGDGTVYFVEAGGYVRKIDVQGKLRTLGGGGQDHTSENILATQASIDAQDIAVDRQGNVYVASEVTRVRKIGTDGRINTVAGQDREAGYSGDGGPATQALLSLAGSVSPLPQAGRGDIAVDADGNLYIADINNDRIRKVNAQGIITTVAGGGKGGETLTGDGGPAFGARLTPTDVAIHASGHVYIAERNWIRKIDSSGALSTVAGRPVPLTGINGPILFSGDGGPATEAQLNGPRGIVLDAQGNLYVADTLNHRVRKVDSGGVIQTVAGNGTAGYSGDGGPATGASLNGPQGITLDSAGNLYISDTMNFRVRRVSPAGIITTVAGNGASLTPTEGIRVGAVSGDGGPAVLAGLALPVDVALDSHGNLFIADSEYVFQGQNCQKNACSAVLNVYGNHRIRRVDSGGTITTIAGTDRPDTVQGYDPIGDGGPALGAYLGLAPAGLAVDSADNLYLSVASSPVVWKITPDGIIHRLAGKDAPAAPKSGGLPLGGLSGDGGPAAAALFNHPQGITVDLSGNLLIADRDNHRVRMVYAAASSGVLMNPPPLVFSPGDVDLDGSVQVGDAVLLLRSLVGLIELNPQQLQAAEMVGDDKKDIRDVILILRRVVGL